MTAMPPDPPAIVQPPEENSAQVEQQYEVVENGSTPEQTTSGPA